MMRQDFMADLMHGNEDLSLRMNVRSEMNGPVAKVQKPEQLLRCS